MLIYVHLLQLTLHKITPSRGYKLRRLMQFGSIIAALYHLFDIVHIVYATQ